MTVSRYLIWEILRPFSVILGILVALFASYAAAGILADAVNSLLPTDTLVESVGLKAMISLEVLIPIALLAAVVLTFGRLHSDSEITAMSALCIPPARIMGAVLTVSLWLAVGVAALSLFGRPWAYLQLHQLSQRGEAMLNVNAMQAGTFYIDEGGRRVIYLGRRDRTGKRAGDIFVRLDYPDHAEIIHSANAESVAAVFGHDPAVQLHIAHIYKIGSNPGEDDEIVDAGTLSADPDQGRNATGRYATAATSSARLAGSNVPAEVAEWQWRLSTPVSTLLLGLLGLPLGRVAPRQNRYAKFGTAILIYAIYYLLCMSARTWVAQGIIAPLPGLWWAPALLGLTVAMALWPHYFAGSRRHPS